MVKVIKIFHDNFFKDSLVCSKSTWMGEMLTLQNTLLVWKSSAIACKESFAWPGKTYSVGLFYKWYNLMDPPLFDPLTCHAFCNRDYKHANICQYILPYYPVYWNMGLRLLIFEVVIMQKRDIIAKNNFSTFIFSEKSFIVIIWSAQKPTKMI